jgi:hypothetical protein
MAMGYEKSMARDKEMNARNEANRQSMIDPVKANSAMVGKARNTNLDEKRKAMAKKKMQGGMR